MPLSVNLNSRILKKYEEMKPNKAEKTTSSQCFICILIASKADTQLPPWLACSIKWPHLLECFFFRFVNSDPIRSVANFSGLQRPSRVALQTDKQTNSKSWNHRVCWKRMRLCYCQSKERNLVLWNNKVCYKRQFTGSVEVIRFVNPRLLFFCKSQLELMGNICCKSFLSV